MSDVTGDGYRLLLGDCLERMGEIADGSVDLILCDLPFGTTANHWDCPIDPARLWSHYRRLIRPRGVVVLHASQPFTSDLVQSNREWFKFCLVWEKNRLTNFFNVKHQPGKSHEDIAVFSPAPASHSPRPSMTFNPQMEPGESWKRRDVKRNPVAHRYHDSPTPMDRESRGGRYPRSVLRFDCEYDLHPTQKPVPLAEYLIRTFSEESAVTLDNCMGSNTTGLACLNTGRKFVGIERDPGYFKIATDRLAASELPLLSR